MKIQWDTDRLIQGWVGGDNLSAITARITRLLATPRPVTTVVEHISRANPIIVPPTVRAGLVLDDQVPEPVSVWKADGMAGVRVFLKPGRDSGFGIFVDDDTETEAAARRRAMRDIHQHGVPVNATYIDLNGGQHQPGTPDYLPEPTDRIIISAWNRHGHGTRTTIAFDAITKLAELLKLRDELAGQPGDAVQHARQVLDASLPTVGRIPS